MFRCLRSTLVVLFWLWSTVIGIEELIQKVVTTQNLDHTYVEPFVNYVNKFNKADRYKILEVSEVAQRYNNYIEADNYIKMRNKLGRLPYVLGHTRYSDWSMGEKITFTLDEQYTDKSVYDCTTVTFDDTAESVNSDFTEYGHEVQDQGTCSSCWDFAAVSMIETNRNIQTSKSEKLSEQYLLDCADESVGSCDGGYATLTLLWVYNNDGVCTEKDYGSYTGEKGSCYSACSTSAKFDNIYCLQSQTDDQIEKALTSYALSFSFEIYKDFYYYTSGIYTCDEDSSNEFIGWHAMSLVGQQDGYYIGKNSWGSDWGIDGYIHFDRETATSTCGMEDFAFVTYKTESSETSKEIQNGNVKFPSKFHITNNLEKYENEKKWLTIMGFLGIVIVIIGVLFYSVIKEKQLKEYDIELPLRSNDCEKSENKTLLFKTMSYGTQS